MAADESVNQKTVYTCLFDDDDNLAKTSERLETNKKMHAYRIFTFKLADHVARLYFRRRWHVTLQDASRSAAHQMKMKTMQ